MTFSWQPIASFFDKETPCSTLVVCKVKCVLVRIVSYCKSEVLLSEVSVSLHNLKNTKCVTWQSPLYHVMCICMVTCPSLSHSGICIWLAVTLHRCITYTSFVMFIPVISDVEPHSLFTTKRSIFTGWNRITRWVW